LEALLVRQRKVEENQLDNQQRLSSYRALDRSKYRISSFSRHEILEELLVRQQILVRHQLGSQQHMSVYRALERSKCHKPISIEQEDVW
jgi:hypothetical protein